MFSRRAFFEAARRIDISISFVSSMLITFVSSMKSFRFIFESFIDFISSALTNIAGLFNKPFSNFLLFELNLTALEIR
jgi:flagellar biosynthesis protein FliQ